MMEERLAALFRETASAHKRAFNPEPEGHDWVPWYAEYLAPQLAGLAGRPIDAAALAADLRAVDAEQRADASGLPWPEFYARWFLRRLS